MSFKITIKSRAKRQLADGVEWYESKQRGLGLKFLNQVDLYLEIIAKHPHHYEMRRTPFREAFIRKFLYLIIYSIKEKEIIVSAIFNTFQDPEQKYESEM